MFTKKQNKHSDASQTKNSESDDALKSVKEEPLESGAEEPTEAVEACQQSPNEAKPLDELGFLMGRYTRLLADFDNFRKRQARERADLIRRANEDLLQDFLPVLDHLEMALAQAPDPTAPFVVGVQMVHDQFVSLLDRYGMTPLDTCGQPFDPNYHEALSQSASEEVPANIIMQQFRRGWLLNGHLVRAAQVIVSSGSAATDETEEANQADQASAE